MLIKAELIQDCIALDRAAQKQLYTVLLPYLNCIAMRYLTLDSARKDVLQETFINIFKNLNQFNAERASFKTWATRICINNCLQNNQKNQKYQTEEIQSIPTEPCIAPVILSQLSNEELIEFMKQMPSAYFEVFNLYILDGFNHNEIAKFLNIDTALSRQRLSRARTWLKKNLPIGYTALSSVNRN